jgi:hypothetical protein
MHSHLHNLMYDRKTHARHGKELIIEVAQTDALIYPVLKVKKSTSTVGLSMGWAQIIGALHSTAPSPLEIEAGKDNSTNCTLW